MTAIQITEIYGIIRMFSRRVSQAFCSASYKNPSQLRVILSESKNIYENLSFENYLFKMCKFEHPTLFIYQNDKTCIIGKHQNPWKECKV
jgi:lipoate-protein ligase A